MFYDCNPFGSFPLYPKQNKNKTFRVGDLDQSDLDLGPSGERSTYWNPFNMRTQSQKSTNFVPIIIPNGVTYQYS